MWNAKAQLYGNASIPREKLNLQTLEAPQRIIQKHSWRGSSKKERPCFLTRYTLKGRPHRDWGQARQVGLPGEDITASRHRETALETFGMKQKPPSGPRKHTPPCLHVDPSPKGQTIGWTPGKPRLTPSQHQAASHGTVWREEWADIQNQTPKPLCQHPLVPDRPAWH